MWWLLCLCVTFATVCCATWNKKLHLWASVYLKWKWVNVSLLWPLRSCEIVRWKLLRHKALCIADLQDEIANGRCVGRYQTSAFLWVPFSPQQLDVVPLEGSSPVSPTLLGSVCQQQPFSASALPPSCAGGPGQGVVRCVAGIRALRSQTPGCKRRSPYTHSCASSPLVGTAYQTYRMGGVRLEQLEKKWKWKVLWFAPACMYGWGFVCLLGFEDV